MILTHCQEYILVMQELSAIVPAKDKQKIIKTAISKVVALQILSLGEITSEQCFIIIKCIHKC
jgi:hypothetical protein